MKIVLKRQEILPCDNAPCLRVMYSFMFHNFGEKSCLHLQRKMWQVPVQHWYLAVKIYGVISVNKMDVQRKCFEKFRCFILFFGKWIGFFLQVKNKTQFGPLAYNVKL
jgi:hypothetical protein